MLLIACFNSINPIDRSQDTPDVFIYKTIKKADNETIIQYAWSTDSISLPGPKYQLVKENDNWKLNNTCVK